MKYSSSFVFEAHIASSDPHFFRLCQWLIFKEEIKEMWSLVFLFQDHLEVRIGSNDDRDPADHLRECAGIPRRLSSVVHDPLGRGVICGGREGAVATTWPSRK